MIRTEKWINCIARYRAYKRNEDGTFRGKQVKLENCTIYATDKMLHIMPYANYVISKRVGSKHLNISWGKMRAVWEMKNALPKEKMNYEK